MHGVVDDGPSLTASGARIATCRDVERDWQIDVVDAVPQGFELTQVVVGVVDIGRAEDRLGWQAQALESECRASLDLGNCLVQLGGSNARHRASRSLKSANSSQAHSL